MRRTAGVAVCLCCTGVWAAERLTVHDSTGAPLAEAVVYIDSPGSRLKTPLVGQIAQRDKHFMPRITVVRVGSAVVFPNQDTVRHHVYSFSPAKVFDIRLYSGMPASPVVFDKAGLVVLGCNIHDWMVGYVKVVDSPWFGLSDASGTVMLNGVSAGELVVRAWYPGLKDEWQQKVRFPLAGPLRVNLPVKAMPADILPAAVTPAGDY